MKLCFKSARQCWVVLWLLALLPVASTSSALANTKPSDAPAKASPIIESSPTWGELTPRQQEALAPLARFWPQMNEARKRKWLAVSHNYHELPEPEQQIMHERMRAWVSLGPREQAQARLEYARAQTLSVDERRARWDAYMALSEEERQRLARHPARPPKGAAIALRPAPSTKIVAPPAAATSKPYPHGFSALRIDTDQIHPRTLLPLHVTGHASP